MRRFRDRVRVRRPNIQFAQYKNYWNVPIKNRNPACMFVLVNAIANNNEQYFYIIMSLNMNLQETITFLLKTSMSYNKLLNNIV